MSEELAKMRTHRKQAAVTALFDYLFLLRYERLASYWEARLGEAIANGEVTVNRTPTAVGLRQVHAVAAEVADSLVVAETVMVQRD